jgi:hypothetical protein
VPVDTSIIGAKTGAWRVTLERGVLANFAHSLHSATGSDPVVAPPTFTFAAPYWSALSSPSQPDDPSGGTNPMHKVMGELHAKGALVLHGEQSFDYLAPLHAGMTIEGEQVIVDIYDKDTDAATMTFIVMETTWRDTATAAPVVTERFNLIARLKK